MPAFLCQELKVGRGVDRESRAEVLEYNLVPKHHLGDSLVSLVTREDFPQGDTLESEGGELAQGVQGGVRGQGGGQGLTKAYTSAALVCFPSINISGLMWEVVPATRLDTWVSTSNDTDKPYREEGEERVSS